jgi:glycosyltransferase involved in cell wall biosynthesis
MQRLIFLNRFFFPDNSATSQILSDLAFELAAAGREVHVVTSQQKYDEPQARLASRETANGVDITRVATTHFGRSALLGRGIDYLSFYSSMWRAVLGLLRPGDILVAKTDPPLTSILAMRAAKLRRAHLVNWLQDLFPEVAVQLGVPFLGGPVGRALASLRDRSLRAAAANVVIGDLMAQRVIARRVPPERVHVIPNWSDDEHIWPISRCDNPLRLEWGLEDKLVVGYSGNLGRAHEFETMLAAAERLRDHPRFIFLFVGGGKNMDRLRRCVEKRDLGHSFRFAAYQRRELLRQSLGAADVHWLSLKPELEGLIVPSKFYGIAAAGRPLIAISSKDGEIAGLVRRHDCGVVIEPGDVDALVATLVGLAADEDKRLAMGARARSMLEAHFARRHAFARWDRVLDAIQSVR